MMVSTKGRYALRVMLDLAQHADGSNISLSDIAKRQQISVKYLEAVMASLNKGGMVISKMGKKGGYRLAKSPKIYSRRNFKAYRRKISPCCLFKRRRESM